MTFEEAMWHSAKLRGDAFEGIVFRLPDKEARMRRYIDFNPYLYARKYGDDDDGNPSQKA